MPNLPLLIHYRTLNCLYVPKSGLRDPTIKIRVFPFQIGMAEIAQLKYMNMASPDDGRPHAADISRVGISSVSIMLPLTVHRISSSSRFGSRGRSSYRVPRECHEVEGPQDNASPRARRPQSKFSVRQVVTAFESASVKPFDHSLCLRVRAPDAGRQHRHSN
jgi:hypothetical protein